MTTEYHDTTEDDSSSFWNQGVSRFRRWLFPALTVTLVLVLIIALGASNSAAVSRLWSLESKVSNMTESLSSAQHLSSEATADMRRIKFSVENNKDQLSSVSEALKQLSSLDSLIRTVAALRCSMERLIHNGSQSDGCCPLGWDLFETSCYFFSSSALDWPGARDQCSAQDAHLLILMSDKEWDFVTRKSSGTFYWIGLTDASDTWEWVNHTPYVMDRRRWRPGQPDSWTAHGLGPGDEDCAHLHSDGRLNDMHCSTRLRYICQRHGQRS